MHDAQMTGGIDGRETRFGAEAGFDGLLNKSCGPIDCPRFLAIRCDPSLASDKTGRLTVVSRLVDPDQATDVDSEFARPAQQLLAHTGR